MKKTMDEILYGSEKKEVLEPSCNFDMEKFKEYVATYDKKKHGLNNDDTIVKDILYGVGLCLNKERFQFAQGYEKFKTFIKAFL